MILKLKMTEIIFKINYIKNIWLYSSLNLYLYFLINIIVSKLIFLIIKTKNLVLKKLSLL